MSVPTMDELAETFTAAYEKARDGLGDLRFKVDGPICVEAGLLAVLDRLKPVVAEAYAEGRTDHRDGHPFDYATRIIDQIKTKDFGLSRSEPKRRVVGMI